MPDGTTISPGSVDIGAPVGGTANYESVRKVFANNCVPCHGNKGGVTLSTYENIKAALSNVQSAIEQNRMPPTGLSPGDKQLLKDWFARGAPEK